jgi:indole-3-glycerol phosphate synthase
VGQGLLKVYYCSTPNGVEQVRELEQFLNTEAEWVLERLATSLSEANDRNYYQGRLDQLAQVRRYLGQPQIMRERASK